MFLPFSQMVPLTFSLFFMGLFGIVLNRHHFILILMSIELMLLSINLNFLFFSVLLEDVVGQLFSIFILTVAAAESAIGLAILLTYYRLRGSITVEKINVLQG